MSRRCCLSCLRCVDSAAWKTCPSPCPHPSSCHSADLTFLGAVTSKTLTQKTHKNQLPNGYGFLMKRIKIIISRLTFGPQPFCQKSTGLPEFKSWVGDIMYRGCFGMRKALMKDDCFYPDYFCFAVVPWDFIFGQGVLVPSTVQTQSRVWPCNPGG